MLRERRIRRAHSKITSWIVRALGTLTPGQEQRLLDHRLARHAREVVRQGADRGPLPAL
nr:hypothetical protein [Streptomyces sp. S1D4-11]QIZ00953.1 hypothetical protein HEP87_53895 [Streptomyces sp. S1D4-11]